VIKTALPVAHLDDIPSVAALIRKYALPIEEILAARAGGA
jgi:molybdopterin-guanine dinucleotide biosynthesis adapter protein